MDDNLNKIVLGGSISRRDINSWERKYQFTPENKFPSFLATIYLAYPATSQDMSAGAIWHMTLKLSASKTPTAPSQNLV